jgi:hypothetical protein
MGGMQIDFGALLRGILRAGCPISKSIERMPAAGIVGVKRSALNVTFAICVVKLSALT